MLKAFAISTGITKDTIKDCKNGKLQEMSGPTAPGKSGTGR
ncbi:MAG: hypothetical protein ABH860_03980 [bacterium]